MKIGTITEIKDNENRVGLTPNNVRVLVEAGHEVVVQSGAGVGAGFSDDEYSTAGAVVKMTPADIVRAVDILVKVKEPLASEYPLLGYLNGKILYTYLHLAAAPKPLTQSLVDHNVSAIAYETIEAEGGLPLLRPMSQVAGVLATQYGAEFLQRKYDGRGVSMGRIDNTDPAQVVVLGSGVVSSAAAITAAGMGAHVVMTSRKKEKAEKVIEGFRDLIGNAVENMRAVEASPDAIAKEVKDADLLVGGVLVPGAKAPVIVTEQMVKSMRKGAVIVDVAIDQGGCVWGSKTTSHSDPTYNLDGKIFCCIPNMPGQVARQSTQALTSQTIGYLVKLAGKGLAALKEDGGFLAGLNTHAGKITCKAVAEDLDMMDKYESANL